MTLKEWLSFGGNEIANNARIYGYARSVGCVGYLKRGGCPTLVDALGDLPYDYENITAAPWYDATQADVSGRFLGVFVLDISGLLDSTRETQVVQNTRGGGQIGAIRRATRESRVKALVLAIGSDALAYGRAWLDRVLSPGACGQHGDTCGVSDVAFFTTCPPPRGDLTPEQYDEALHPLRRYLHDVAVTSGPFTTDESNNGRVYIENVEWTFTSERPWVYGQERSVDLPSVPSTVVADVPLNLARYPSAELSSGTVLLATNLNTNPSLETNTTGWGAASSVVTGTDPAPYRTGGSSTEKAGHGTTSYRARILGNGSTEVAASRCLLWAQCNVTVAPVAGQRFSAGMWVAVTRASGDVVTPIHRVSVWVEWFNSGGTSLGPALEYGVLDPADYATGGYFSISKLQAPAGAVTAQLRARADIGWRSSATPANNTDFRLYADMATLTTP